MKKINIQIPKKFELESFLDKAARLNNLIENYSSRPHKENVEWYCREEIKKQFDLCCTDSYKNYK